MRSPRVLEAQVLIIGAGPAGLTAAAALARHSVDALVVDRRPAGSDHPRATLISTSSMELMRRWGLEQEVRAGEMDVELRAWACETLASPEGAAVPVGVPTPEQAAAISPTGPACVPQDDLEPVLARHAQALGARVRRGTELVGMTQAPDGIEALLRDADDNHRVVRTRYLIGADGAHGATRPLLGIPRRGPGVVSEAITALFHAPLWQIAGARRHLIYWIGHPEAAGVLVPAGRGDRWIYGFTREPGIVDARAYGEAELARLIRLAAGAADVELRIDRVGSFAYTAQIADRFREGDVFLAGDAAHRITPRGGTGMNTAIRDGYDLGWKLAWTLRGWAGAELLDSYEAERRPVAAHNVARSADANGSTREVTDELHVDLGGRIPHVWVGSGPSRRSTLDLLGPGLTRFTGPGSGMPGEPAPAPFAAAPVVEHRLSAVTARALGIGARGSLLVRPDGAPARVTAQVELSALSA